ncbi:hypothetical protein D5R40_33395 [Okeania hirsuta]|uniref:Uncharacterized protein n=1 Tax=Okeania hirsuta TaxID=1458930 RepID=A0A3N6NN28_9CYAN|nr:hypothetical protein D5R40_33395 [Okeania hirsuta]
MDIDSHADTDFIEVFTKGTKLSFVVRSMILRTGEEEFVVCLLIPAFTVTQNQNPGRELLWQQ